jgi:GxxExxY protein
MNTHIRKELKRQDILFPELSYQIMGYAYAVFNTIGSGFQEKYYQKALALEFKRNSLKFKEQWYIPLSYHDKSIGRQYADFIVADSIIVEIKQGDYFSPANIKQVDSYLKASGLQLGILINFGSTRVKSKRILNIH